MARGIDLENALRNLYSAPPDEFLALRTSLAGTLRAQGDAAAAAEMAKRRKPTQAAWLINHLALADPSVLERVTKLGDELRATQQALDAPKLRALSGERRKLVAQLADEAFGYADRGDPPVGLRDEVRSTFDAAIADPDVAARLGQLQRAEQFSGFGFGEGAAPLLTLVRGGKDDPQTSGEATTAEPTSKPAAKPKLTAAQRKLQRELEAAHETLARASTHKDEADEREHDARDQLRRAEAKLSAAKKELEAAKQEYEASRTAAKEARSAVRDARQKFDRLERQQKSD